MPDGSTLAVFVAAAMVLIVIPGPNHVYIVTRSLSEGRRPGVGSAIGVETGTLVHAAAAAVGLAALVASSATAFSVVKYLGAAYLIYLGVRTLLRPKAAENQPAEHRPAGFARSLAEGVVVNVLNPKVALFFLALLPQFVDPSAGSVPLQLFVLGAIMAVLGLTVDLAYVVAAAWAGDRMRHRLGASRPLAYVTGGVYLSLGAAAALVGPPDTR